MTDTTIHPDVTAQDYPFNEWQQRWISDLLYERYPQGFCYLFDGKGYCCLGVGCLSCSQEIELCSISPESVYASLTGYPTKDLLRLWSGFGDLKKPITLCHSTLCHSLVVMNDTLKWSHALIGRYILEHPENVFLPLDQ